MMMMMMMVVGSVTLQSVDWLTPLCSTESNERDMKAIVVVVIIIIIVVVVVL